MIYFDNAATSWPKPEAVRIELSKYFGDAGGNPGRSGHRMSIAAARIIESTRDAVAALFHVNDPSRVVFASNATHALNLALCGLLEAGDHVVTTSAEHNSVMRPLRYLETIGVQVTVVTCSSDGTLDLNDVRRALRPSTRLLVSTHASNVLGTVFPVDGLAALARKYGVLFLIDAAQTAGSIPIDVQQMGVDLLAFTGHKGLLGPTGTGGLYIREGVTLKPVLRGGTGSDSASETQPEFLPDAFESGTANVLGLIGLGAAVRFLCDVGIETVQAHERGLVTQFMTGASSISGITVYGPRDPALRCSVVSFNMSGTASPSEVTSILDQSFGIMSRPGLHCAPGAHRTLGTFPTGTVRFSFGWFNQTEEVEAALRALKEIASWATGRKAGPVEAYK